MNILHQIVRAFRKKKALKLAEKIVSKIMTNISFINISLFELYLSIMLLVSESHSCILVLALQNKVKPVLAVTCIKRSPFSCPFIENSI
jgi:hypothetical protein